MDRKKAVTAALDRADAKARRAVKTHCSKDRLIDHRLDSLGSHPTDVRLGLTPWAPTSTYDEAAKYLRASSALRGASCVLLDKRKTEEHFDRIDRQIAEVDRTRAMINEVCGGWRPSPRARSASPAMVQRGPPSSASAQCLNSSVGPSGPAAQQTSTGALDKGQAVNPRRAPEEDEEVPRRRAKEGASRPLATGSRRVIELKPRPCLPEELGSDCACCLCTLAAGELVLAFPCPARHVFHAGCLQRWLRAAGTSTTCPMCRSWPKGTNGSRAERKPC